MNSTFTNEERSGRAYSAVVATATKAGSPTLQNLFNGGTTFRLCSKATARQAVSSAVFGKRLIRRLISLTALSLALNVSFAWADSPTVSNVRATQRAQTQLVDVFYDLSATNNGPFSVSMAVSTNNGTTYDLPASSFTGNGIGSAVTLGTRKQVMWNAGADWPGKYSSAVRFNVSAVENQTPSGMVLIPAGSNSGTDPDFGAYSLTVSAFYMDRTEVPKAKWDEVRSWGLTHGYTDLPAGGGKASNHPVQTVSWYDCVKWCNARSEMENRTPAYYTTLAKSAIYKTGQINIEDNCVNWSSGYRLPKDTEWEYAARGGVSSKRFPWSDSDTIQHARANYYSSSSDSYDTSPTRGYHPSYQTGGSPYTSPAGSFAPNGYGLYDMAGNVWEWCWDWYPGYEGSARVRRGGSWHDFAHICRVGARISLNPDSVYFGIGFRAVLPPGQ